MGATDGVRPVLRTALRPDWSQFEGTAALRCAVGVAIPLAAGLLLHQPAVSAFGAVGAVSVGFGSFQGAYRSRAAVMLYAATGMALAMVTGSLAGHSPLATVITSALFAFGAGLAVSLGPSAAFVGLQCVVAVLVASGFPSDLPGAATRGGLVFAGGLAQTVLVVVLWPLRRFSAERAALSALYRSLASFAAAIGRGEFSAPEPHTLASMPSPLADPQPFARRGDLLVFQALVDEAERIRTSLAAFTTVQSRASRRPEGGCLNDVADRCRLVLDEIATALERARAPREETPLWAPLEACARALPDRATLEALFGQMRAAWRMAGVLASRTADGHPSAVPPIVRRPDVGDALTTLRSNLTLRSAVFRHAVRVSVVVAIATGIYAAAGLTRGYWLPMTALLVLKPEFHDTFARGVARIAGTIVGAAIATVIVEAVAPGPGALALLVLVFVWGCYAVFRINYALFTVCVTGYVVFILMVSGVAEMPAATLRAAYTIAGGAIAMLAYAAWPTWAGQTARGALADMLDAHRAYLDALLGAFAAPGSVDSADLGRLRAAGRLARSNAEAVLQRMLGEPASRAALAPAVAVGLLAALRRNALAALALHAAIERGAVATVPRVDDLRVALDDALRAVASALRSGQPPPALPRLRALQREIFQHHPGVLADETDLVVDSINTAAELLRQP